MTATISDRERRIRRRLRDDFPHYARACLKIRTKGAGIRPFALNAVQQRLHERIERQRTDTGRVRALVLKGRQMGVSTYVGGRFYWRATHGQGLRAYILTHMDAATANLFDMVKRFHDQCPPLLRPMVRASNANELSFGRLDGGYRVGTAKAKGVGRSETIQLFHGSEVAFWPNAGDHATGVLQAVADAPGTEVILESTANGLGGLFYSLWLDAEAGRSHYQPIFLPWFEHEEYRAEPPTGWVPPGAWSGYEARHGLERAQTFWAWRKNTELVRAGGDSGEIGWPFRQEYPATAREAFQLAGADAFLPPDAVTAARGARLTPNTAAPLVVGVDVAGPGKDETVAIDRQGRIAGGAVYDRWRIANQMELAGRLGAMLTHLPIDVMFIDVGGGYGAGVLDRLAELGFTNVVGVQFGGRAGNDTDYANKRAEIYGLLRRWLTDPAGCQIPDDEVLARELAAVRQKGLTSRRQIVLEPKEQIRRTLGFSPDAADALALTFAYPVVGRAALAEAGRIDGPRRAYDPHHSLRT